jgi:hypothetical protein
VETRVRDARPDQAGDDARCEHEQHIGMFSLDDHIAINATRVSGRPERMA